MPFDVNTVEISVINDETGLTQVRFIFGYLDRTVDVEVYKTSLITRFGEYSQLFFQQQPDRDSGCSVCGRSHSRSVLTSRPPGHIESITLEDEEYIDFCRICCESVESQIEQAVASEFSAEVFSQEL